MFFWRPKFRPVEGVDPQAWLGGAPRRYGEVQARAYINLSGAVPDGYPLGIFVVWRPLSSGGPPAEAVDPLLDAIDPLASTVSSYWFDDGTGVAAVAMAAWLHRRKGWTVERALAATTPKSGLLTGTARERWFG